MLTAIPAAMLMRRVGGRAGLMIGVMAAIIGGTLCTVAIFYRHFELFCVGSALVGAFNAFGQQYRFAAADAASVKFRSRAISLVLAGGVVAAFAGPNLARWTVDLLEPVTYAGSYAANIVIYGLSFAILAFAQYRRLPLLPSQWRRWIRNYHYSGSFPGGRRQRHDRLWGDEPCDDGDATCHVKTWVRIWRDHNEWHALAMFAPLFVTGHIIKRFGVMNVIMTGAL